jgi:RNA polymerase-binding transcription factor DksA
MAAPLTATRPTDPAPPEVQRLTSLQESLRDELAVQDANLDDLRATITALTGQSDVDSILERELAERALAHGLTVIGDIRAALERIDGGTYGNCEVCGDPIPLARLEAITFARHCVGCSPGATTLLG